MGFFKSFSSKPLGRNEFAALVSKGLSEAGLRFERYDEVSFSLHRADGFNLNLHNGYSSFCAADKCNRQAVLDDFVLASVALLTTPKIPDDFEAIKQNILPAVRSASFVSLTALHSRSSQKGDMGRRMAKQPLANGLVVCLAIDGARTISFVNEDSLSKWQMEFGDVLKIAIGNLRDKTDPRRMVQRAPGLFIGQWADTYEASRLLLTDLMHRLPLDGEPVAFAPSRNQLWVTGSRNNRAIEEMLKFGQQEHFGAYPLSPHLYVLQDRQWTSFEPEPAELREGLRLLVLRRNATDYGQQKGYLEAIHKKEGADVFVSPCQVPKDSVTGRPYSICVWPKGAETLLPITDRVALLMDVATKKSIDVSWTTMQSVVGKHLEKVADLFPERYRVRSFPTEEEIATLQRAAIV